MGNKGRKLELCKCDNCGIEFQKPQSEITRNQKLNRKNFCSRTCVGKNNTKNFGDKKSDYDISRHSKNRKDGYTKFRYHFRNISKRNKELDVTVEDLKEVWNNQKGLCPYLGIELQLNSYGKIKKDPITSASLDRIDSSRGYVKENIQWISRSMNYLKNDMSEQQVFEIMDLIYRQKKGSK
jgi:hypothetical protein